ncbi:unnamed protein product [Parnassius apollo]|uniref:(apollo) hypothetical protein n=1 Tax=Parnassius apollo TaxID=110799 RepID=A0A8S3WKM1_PARAO|nr:unnamed protein product [Parnassius apollo]
MRPKCSAIWTYFSEVDADTVRCKICDQTYSRKRRGTSGLRSHLKSRHEVEYAEYEQKDTALKKAAVDKRKLLEETPLQQAKRQVTLQEALQRHQYWDTSHEKSCELDNLICEMLALQDLPFNFVEGIGFRRLIHAVQPKYNLRGRQSYTSHLCNYIYPKLRNKDAIVLYTSQHTNLPQFTPNDWLQLESCATILKPFEEATKTMNPKYKTKFFNEITKESIESELISLCQDQEGHGAQAQPQIQSFEHDVIQHNQHFHHTDTETLPSTSSGANFSTGRFLQSMLSEMLASAPNSDDEESPIAPIDRFLILKSLIINYIKEKRIGLQEDSLLWWKINPKYFELYRAVRQYLSAPPSSIPSERLFSGAGLVYD